jgi:ribosomal protein L44E
MEAYLVAKIARLKFDADIRKHQVLSRYINEIIIGDSKKVEVLFGNGSMPSDSPMRGYVKVPYRLLRHKLMCHPKIEFHLVNEFRTTMLCSRCFRRLKIPKGKHRYVYCRHCNQTFHRDINAAINILRLAMNGNTQETRELNFQYGQPRPPLQETNKKIYKRILREALEQENN